MYKEVFKLHGLYITLEFYIIPTFHGINRLIHNINRLINGITRLINSLSWLIAGRWARPCIKNGQASCIKNGYGTTNAVYGTNNADAGVGIGYEKGGSRNLTKNRPLINRYGH